MHSDEKITGAKEGRAMEPWDAREIKYTGTRKSCRWCGFLARYLQHSTKNFKHFALKHSLLFYEYEIPFRSWITRQDLNTISRRIRVLDSMRFQETARRCDYFEDSLGMVRQQRPNATFNSQLWRGRSIFHKSNNFWAEHEIHLRTVTAAKTMKLARMRSTCVSQTDTYLMRRLQWVYNE